MRIPIRKAKLKGSLNHHSDADQRERGRPGFRLCFIKHTKMLSENHQHSIEASGGVGHS